MLQEEAPEQAREHPHGEEESRATGEPLRAVGGEPTARDHTVQMGISDTGLPPRVQYRKEPQLGTEMRGMQNIRGDSSGVSAGGFSALSDSISVPVRPNARFFA